MREYIITTEKGANQQLHELIRCKDCKWNKADKWVDCVCMMTGMYGRTIDNFCSLAEKREDNETD